eukprot:597859_1
MAVSTPPPIPKQEYIHVLKTMDPCGQSDIINKFIEEAEAYETKTPLEETDQQSNHETLHCNKKYEVRRMALTKIFKMNSGKGLATYFALEMNKSVRCDVDPKCFLELCESAVSNPWELIRDAKVNHSLSMFFNGNNEGKSTESIGDGDDILCKQTTANVHCVFTNMIDTRFDTNDMELMRIVLFQLSNCWKYFLR